MASFLLWEYVNKQVGRFHQARSVAKKDEMVAAGMFDATNVKGTDLPYPCKELPPLVTLTVTVANRVATFTFAPALAGSLDYGNGVAAVAIAAGTATKAYTYPDIGTYTAVFTPTDAGGKSKCTVTTAAITYAVAAVVTELSVAFTVTPKGAGKLSFGDGTADADLTTSANTNTHAYAAAGTYEAKFTPTDTDDAAVTKSVVTVAPAPPA
jgi:PKD repeat protein